MPCTLYAAASAQAGTTGLVIIVRMMDSLLELR